MSWFYPTYSVGDTQPSTIASRWGAFSGVACASCRDRSSLRHRELIGVVDISEVVSQCMPQCC